MFNRLFLNSGGLILATFMLAACGPGGGNSGDVFPREPQPASVITGPNSFLLFPNPQKQDQQGIYAGDGSVQTNTTAYATAYYEAIDNLNERDTLEKWKTKNGFGNLTTGTEYSVVFGDVKDLGYGRRMTARKITSGPDAGNIAFMVDNYLVTPVANYTYNSFNTEAAVVQDKRWHVGTNGIEFSASTCQVGLDFPTLAASAVSAPGHCDSTIRFAKFYTFDPKTGVRLLEAQLDGRGKKAMPGICVNCHGGRADPLTPVAGSLTGKQLFPLVMNTASLKRGDVMANLQPFKVDTFDFSTRAGYTRAEQEANLKELNKLILSSYPIAAATAYLEDAARRTPIVYGEWPGTAAALIKNAYGGDNLPNAAYADSYVPTGWSGVNQTPLYQNVVASSCRTCHILRGNAPMTELNFETYCIQTIPGTCNTPKWGTTLTVYDTGTYFYGYADRIKAHVIDRGNMPLAKIVSEGLWGSSAIETLANFLQTAQSGVVRTNGAVLKPGRPVAVPGPDRTTISPATLNGAGSLYATSYSWTLVAPPVGTSLTNATSVTPALTALDGTTNVLRLVVSNGTTQSDPVDVTVKIDSTLSGISGSLKPAPTAIRFADIKAVLQSTTAACTGCHTPSGGPPIYYTNYDRNADSLINTTDDIWFYYELRGRINFTDIAASPLLRKPSGHHHGGNLIFDTADTTACAVPAECGTLTKGVYFAMKYNMFVNWILNGAPY